MKQCTKCHEVYNDELEKCPNCDIPLTAYQDKQPPKIVGIFKEYQKGIISCSLVVAFLLGFGFKSCTGISRTDYKKLEQKNDTLIKEKTDLKDEYDKYKAKMQPYEAQQQADVKAAEEKKVAEEKAKKEAAEKAKKEKAEAEAQEKAKKENELRKSTLGFTVDEFITKFNSEMYNLGKSITATKGQVLSNGYGNSDIIDMNTSSSNVKLSSYVKQNFATTIIVKGTGDGTTTSATEQLFSMVAAAKVIDSSLSTEEISNFLVDIIADAPRDGTDYTKSKNNFKYTINADGNSTWLVISK